MASLLRCSLRFGASGGMVGGRVGTFSTRIRSGLAPSPLPVLSSIYPASTSSSTSQYRHFNQTVSSHSKNTTDSAAMSQSAQPFLDTLAERRTYYQLSKKVSVSDARIQEIVKHALLHVPSSFNSQSTRTLILFNGEHDKLWDITADILKAIVPADSFAGTKQRIDGFKAAYATILFFDDRPTVQDFQGKFAAYAERFPLWASESNGMHQYAIWTALEAEGLGCNLQHYNPLIDAKVQSEWGVPETWELKAELVIGGREGEAGQKTFKPVEGERLIVKGL